MKASERKNINESNLTLGQMLRQLRKDAGKTQKELANYLGVKPVTYSAYEVGRIAPGADKLYMLSKLYDINIAILMAKTSSDERVAGSFERENNKEVRSDIAGNYLRETREEALKTDELVYYYKNLSESHRNAVYELTKSLYRAE